MGKFFSSLFTFCKNLSIRKLFKNLFLGIGAVGMLLAFGWQIGIGSPDIAVTICLTVMFALYLATPLVEKFLEKTGNLFDKYLEKRWSKSSERSIEDGKSVEDIQVSLKKEIGKEKLTELEEVYGNSKEENVPMKMVLDFSNIFIRLSYSQLDCVSKLARCKEKFKDEVEEYFYARAKNCSYFYKDCSDFLLTLCRNKLIECSNGKIFITLKGQSFVKYIEIAELDIN